MSHIRFSPAPGGVSCWERERERGEEEERGRGYRESKRMRGKGEGVKERWEKQKIIWKRGGMKKESRERGEKG